MAIEALVMILTLLLCLYIHAKCKEKSSSKLYWKKNKRNTAILSLCEKLNAGYQPTFWAHNKHIQTILGCLGHFFKHRFQFRTEYIQMRDGATVSLEWYVDGMSAKDDRLSPTNADPILLISTWAFGPDIISMCEEAVNSGYQPVVYNSRGHNVPLTTNQVAAFFHASDFKEIIDYVHHVYPFSDLYALGYSLGAVPIINYLGIRGKSSLITAAVLVSTTLDLDAILSSGFKEPYEKCINGYFRKIIRENTCLRSVMEESGMQNNWTLHDILRHTHLAVNPYDNFDDYIKVNNPMSYIRNIRTPTLFINSLDDPVIDDKVPAYLVLRSNPYCLEVVTETGGHCGFLEGFQAGSWTNGISLEFYSAVTRCRSLILSPVKNGFTRLRSVTR